MTRNYYRTENYSHNHSTFGGEVYQYDFDGYTSIHTIANRIISDMKFDQYCKIQLLNNEKMKKQKENNNRE